MKVFFFWNYIEFRFPYMKYSVKNGHHFVLDA